MHDFSNTDLYELTMAAGYFHNRVDGIATFELSIRSMPENRSYFVFSGLHAALDLIRFGRFPSDAIEHLRSHPAFVHVEPAFFDYLAQFRFTGTLRAVPEGTVVFAQEPIVQVTAPVIEAQLLETYLLASIHIEVLVATKASRIADAASADGVHRHVIDFGSRRAHGADAAVCAARAACIGGCAGTSNLKAGAVYGLNTFGTMAHSWVSVFNCEEDAFRRYHELFPDTAVLLLDTYDTLAAIDAMDTIGRDVKAVRLDSGDLDLLSRTVRKKLDAKGFVQTKIFASGDLDEYSISKLVSHGAPIDGFGVGTRLVTSADCPFVPVVYKLVQMDDKNGLHMKCKISQGKASYPGKKQVYRCMNRSGVYTGDFICLADEPEPSRSFPLLETYVEQGNVCMPYASVSSAAQRAAVQKRCFSPELFRLDSPQRYPVLPSKRLEGEYRQLADSFKTPPSR